MNYSTLLVERNSDGVAVITVNRPDKMNALNALVMKELDHAVEDIIVDRSIRAVIITGAGEKAFVAGADISELANLNEETGHELATNGQSVFMRIARSPKPFVAVVEGYSLGGGCELALACHLRVAGANAVFGLPEVTLGLIPGYGGTQRLTRLVGQGRAMEMILTGNPVKADQALNIGLVNRVVEPGKGMDEARVVIGSILKRAPLAVAAAIKAIIAAGETPEIGFETEADLFANLCSTNDFKVGTTAFLAKEKPTFTGD
jgi:enoyl-CoA hydratase